MCVCVCLTRECQVEVPHFCLVRIKQAYHLPAVNIKYTYFLKHQVESKKDQSFPFHSNLVQQNSQSCIINSISSQFYFVFWALDLHNSITVTNFDRGRLHQR